LGVLFHDVRVDFRGLHVYELPSARLLWRDRVTIGGIQNVWTNQGVDPELFTSQLRPESRRWWEELNAFWRGERRFVGEGFQREITADEVRKIRQEISDFNEKLKQERESATCD